MLDNEIVLDASLNVSKALFKRVKLKNESTCYFPNFNLQEVLIVSGYAYLIEKPFVY